MQDKPIPQAERPAFTHAREMVACLQKTSSKKGAPPGTHALAAAGQGTSSGGAEGLASASQGVQLEAECGLLQPGFIQRWKPREHSWPGAAPVHSPKL